MESDMGTDAPSAANPLPGRDVIPPDEVKDVARGIATAVAPESGLTDVQATLLSAIANALTGEDVNYHNLEPLGPDELAERLRHRDDGYRQRIVHHMVLGELVLRPLPVEVSVRVAKYAKALGIDDRFVRVARRYAQGAYGLAWMDLHRSGFSEESQQADLDRSSASAADPFERPPDDPALAEKWAAFEELPAGTLGRCVWEMYDSRGFALPGTAKGATPYLAQHDFVHVLADYGTNLKGELEVFAFIGRADPEPKGFAWLATLIGLFETGYISSTGFFDKDVHEPVVQAPGMQHRLADAIRRGKAVCACNEKDLFLLDYDDEYAPLAVEEVRSILAIPPKGPEPEGVHSPGLFDRDGMSEMQQRYAAAREGGTA
jgi:hypothetical protein